MEKFGLFDLIDKFNTAASGKSDFSAGKEKAAEQTTSQLKDPETTAPPQYMLNAKTLAYIARHEELVASVPPRAKARRGRPKTH